MRKLILLFVFMACASIAFSQEYSRAIGLRLGWDYGVSYKHFLNQKAAIEAIGTFRTFGIGGFRWSYLRLAGVYLVHNPFPDVPGLQWYYGGGATFLTYGGDYGDYYPDDASIGLGIVGAIGLDYKFENAPISLTIDWMPSFVFGSYYRGFGGELGGLGARYTF